MKIETVVDWQDHRGSVVTPRDNSLSRDVSHNALHVAKALGPFATLGEHLDHGEVASPIESKRAADLIIHAIWLVRNAGFNPAEVVRKRIVEFEDGFKVPQ